MDAATAAKLQQVQALVQNGQASAALAICDAARGRFPDNPDIAHLRAMTLSQMGRTDEARADFEKAAQAHPNKGVILVNYGNAMKRAGLNDDALKIYRRAVDASPQSAPAWNAYGLALQQAHDRDGAQAAFEKAVRVNPNFGPAHCNLGNLLLANDAVEASVQCFSKALAYAPQMVAALINRGAALRRLGDIPAAINDHKRAVQIAPNFAEGAYQLGASLATDGDPSGAIAAFERALALEPGHKDARRQLVQILWTTGHKNAAFDMLDRSIVETRDPEIMVMRAELSFRDADVEAARASARAALETAPNAARAWTILGRAEQACGHAEDGFSAAKRAVELDPADFDARHHFVEIALAQGRNEDALAMLEGDAPPDHQQKQIGLRATTQRLLGRDDYRRYYDYDRFTAQIAIDPPAGYGSIEAFNAALRASIEPLHQTREAPIDQTLFGGTQSVGRLWNNPDPVIQAYVRAMRDAAGRFVEGLPDDPGHPFLSRKSKNLTCAGAWSVMLSSGGGHVDHIHPAGWISACYYVDAPGEVLGGDRAGCLRLGGSGVPGVELEAERWLKPIPGTVIFFPSYVWHGVESFESTHRRVTAPFDLAPAAHF